MMSFNLLWKLMFQSASLGGMSLDRSTQTPASKKRCKQRSTQLRRVTVFRPGNPCFTSYELDQPLGESSTYFVFKWHEGEVLPRGLYHADEDGLPVEPFMLALAEKLYEVEGVARHRHPSLGDGVKMTAYQVSVVKTTERSDEDIEAEILEVIAAAFGTSASSLKVTVENDHSKFRYANNP